MKALNYFLDFGDTIEEDPRIGPTHISLYHALLYEYIKGACRLPIAINRRRVLQKAKICRKTYNKRMGELQAYGYIDYVPSNDPSVRSRVYLNRL